MFAFLKSAAKWVGAHITGGAGTTSTLGSWLKANPHMGSAIKYAVERRDMNRAMRRQYSDLRGAGINPILAGRLGGAQTPTMEGIGQVSNESRGHDYKEPLSKAQINEIASKIGVNEQEVKRLERATELLIEQTRSAKSQADIDQIIANWSNENKSLAVMNKLGLDVMSLKEIGKFLVVGGSQEQFDEMIDRVKTRSNQAQTAFQIGKQASTEAWEGFKSLFSKFLGRN